MGTEKFDKRAYDIDYNKTHTILYGWRMRKEFRPKLDEYSQSRGIPLAELLRQLVDADAKAHGLPPVFAIDSEVESETDQK
nr:MAG TPA: antitoxin [Caudoviricetes sp.]